MKIAVYPGTFDPITLGHLDIIRRGAHLVDKLVIGVTTNPSKEPMFTVAERLAMVRREVEGMPGNIDVVEFDSLLMEFAEQQGATTGPAGEQFRDRSGRHLSEAHERPIPARHASAASGQRNQHLEGNGNGERSGARRRDRPAALHRHEVQCEPSI